MKRREHEKAQHKENDDKPGADLVANNARHLRKFIIIHHLTPPSVHGHARRDRRASSSTARVAPMAGDKRSRCWFLTAGHEMPLIEKPHLLPLIFLTRTNRWSRQGPCCQIPVTLNVVFPTFSKKNFIAAKTADIGGKCKKTAGCRRIRPVGPIRPAPLRPCGQARVEAFFPGIRKGTVFRTCAI